MLQGMSYGEVNERQIVEIVKKEGEREWVLHFLNENERERIKFRVRTNDVQDILLNIGIPASLLGYSYIIYASELIFMDPGYLKSITKLLYVDIAIKYMTTPSRVERAIRHAITVGWTIGNMEYINSMFKNSVNPARGIPSNSQFLSRLYHYLEICNRSELYGNSELLQ